jgi:RNA recognition motif-containing protein
VVRADKQSRFRLAAWHSERQERQDGKKRMIMSKKLYVGNLDYATTDASLGAMFAQFGDVHSAQVVMDRDTGRSKGFGFVEMASDQAGRDAIAGLNGKDIDGRQLTVNEARPKKERGSRGGYSGRDRY